jgi:hypothetical protein
MPLHSTAKIKTGAEFVHDKFIEPDAQLEDGQLYADAPKALMLITKVTAETVYFRYLDGSGSWKLNRDQFVDRFDDQFA